MSNPFKIDVEKERELVRTQHNQRRRNEELAYHQHSSMVKKVLQQLGEALRDNKITTDPIEVRDSYQNGFPAQGESLDPKWKLIGTNYVGERKQLVEVRLWWAGAERTTSFVVTISTDYGSGSYSRNIEPTQEALIQFLQDNQKMLFRY